MDDTPKKEVSGSAETLIGAEVEEDDDDMDGVINTEYLKELKRKQSKISDKVSSEDDIMENMPPPPHQIDSDSSGSDKDQVNPYAQDWLKIERKVKRKKRKE